jgi:hypothetical protein
MRFFNKFSKQPQSEPTHSVGSSNGLSGLSNGTAARQHASTKTSRNVSRGRILFIFCLAIVAAVLGYMGYYLIRQSETDLASSQFESIADRALTTSQDIVERKTKGTMTMATIAASEQPFADVWPYVTIIGYEETATSLIETSDGREMGFCPLVTPEQLSTFEDFAYDYYENTRLHPFPNGTAVSSFGKGVWGVNPELETTDNKYHETDGSTYYGSPNKIFAPILHPALLLNLHFQEARGVAIDNILSCSEERAAGSDAVCGSITDMLILTSQDVEPGPGALIFQPIYPKFDNLTIVGTIASSIVWAESLQNVFATRVSGVDCVLRTVTQVYTWGVNEGIPFLK